MGRLNGKTAIVTGGANGMGEATARLFVQEGAKVLIGDVAEEKGQALADELGDAAQFMKMDVSLEDDWAAAIEQVSSMGSFNVLVNNAAIVHMDSISNTTVADFERVFRINQLSCFLGVRAAIDPMKAAGGGSIINISSIDGMRSQAGLMTYSSTKWAVRGMTKAAALELGQYGIRVNSVHPGGIYTDMGGKGTVTEEELNRDTYHNVAIPRVGQPEEVAYLTLFLASDEASYCTASEYSADGGWLVGARDPRMPCS